MILVFSTYFALFKLARVHLTTRAFAIEVTSPTVFSSSLSRWWVAEEVLIINSLGTDLGKRRGTHWSAPAEKTRALKASRLISVSSKRVTSHAIYARTADKSNPRAVYKCPATRPARRHRRDGALHSPFSRSPKPFHPIRTIRGHKDHYIFAERLFRYYLQA